MTIHCHFKPVAPFTGAWIEIEANLQNQTHYLVAPFTGAWIEIVLISIKYPVIYMSLPSRERGLKYPVPSVRIGRLSRSLHGSVD